MRHHIPYLTIALGTAALVAACGGRTSSVNITEERAQSSLKANANQRMELIGCVKPATTKAEGSFILQHVTMPPGEILPENSSSGTLIPRGSWVRLAGPDFQKYVGKQVLVSGNLVDAPTGTAGRAAPAKPGDYVTWNTTPGETPLFAVESLKDQGECKAE